MGKIFRLYNQNRMKVWILILAIIFVMLIIQVLNGMYKDINIESNKVSKNVEQEEKSYEKQSKSLVSDGEVTEYYQKDFGDLIENFLEYCKNHEPEKAYGLLSQDCKDILYPTETIFKEQYYEPKFSTEKKYTFQSWTSTETYTYLIKIFDNMLVTGTGSSQKYIQDYISIIKENGTYKLNINGLVEKINRKATTEKDGISINIDYSEIYMDYEIAKVVIKNNTENTILLDSRRKTDSVYLVDSKDIKFEAMLYENLDNDLLVEPGEERTIKIKFSNPYQERRNTVKYVFSNIYKNANEIYYGVNNEEMIIEL